MAKSTKELVGLLLLAKRLRVSPSWLRAEAEAGRIPCLRTDRHTLLFNPAAVRARLAELAAHTYEAIT